MPALLAASVHAAPTCPPGRPRLIIYHAGSLSAALKPVESLFEQRSGVCIVDVAGGSVQAARDVTAGGMPCDIYASADDQVIERMLKPAKFADWTIRFAEGAMVLAYRTTSQGAATIAAPGTPFDPPRAVPDAAADWALQLTQAGVVVGGSHPFLDPGGYRADMIFQLAQATAAKPNLYGTLLGHYAITKAGDRLGQNFDYQFIYEHSALAAALADTTGSYRYVHLPDEVNLGASRPDLHYERAAVTMPGLQAPALAPLVTMPATRVTWGLTVLNTAPHREQALAFLALLFSPEGAALQAGAGPAPISPPVASAQDHALLPAALQPLVRARPTIP